MTVEPFADVARTEARRPGRPASPDPTAHVAIRVPKTQLATIDKLAQEAQLTRTAYLIRAALGELHTPPDDERLQNLDWRLSRLERHLGLNTP